MGEGHRARVAGWRREEEYEMYGCKSTPTHPPFFSLTTAILSRGKVCLPALSDFFCRVGRTRKDLNRSTKSGRSLPPALPRPRCPSLPRRRYRTPGNGGNAGGEGGERRTVRSGSPARRGGGCRRAEKGLLSLGFGSRSVTLSLSLPGSPARCPPWGLRRAAASVAVPGAAIAELGSPAMEP